MQRALCRILRTSCSTKLRDNEKSPILATEDINYQKSKNRENCKPLNYTLTDAIGWTTSLVLTYEFVHRRRVKFSQLQLDPSNECSLTSTYCSSSWWTNYLKYCPFGLAKVVNNQPVIGIGIPTTARSINDASVSPTSSSLSKSIDTTPFLKESESLFFPSTFTFRCLSPTFGKTEVLDDEEDDDCIQFDASLTKFDEAKSNRPSSVDSQLVGFAEKLVGDIYSALGSFKILLNQPQKGSTNNPADKDSGVLISPIELMEKGAALGSGRALYNIGVAYDRLNETKLAREYYQKSADVGHPLGAYNTAVFLFKDGKIFEGLRLMKYAGENGVDEATEIMNLIVDK